MHSFYHRMLPENFDNYFKSGSTQHSYNTRSITSEGYYLERVVTKSGQQGWKYGMVRYASTLRYVPIFTQKYVTFVRYMNNFCVRYVTLLRYLLLE